MSDDLREAMRQARRASGMPFKTFARITGFSESHLRSVENGTRTLSIDIAAGYDKALGTGDTFAREFGDDDVNRRGFLGLAAILGLDPGSRTFGRADVEQLHADFDRLRELDSKLGGSDTFRLYAAELARTKTILTKGHYSDQVRTALIKLLAEQSQQAGWAAFDGGAEQTALALFEHSRLAAEKASADDLAANALILTAYVSPNAPGEDALKRSENYCVTPAVRPLLDSRRALSYAARGDAHNAYLHLERAYKGLETGVDEAPHWAAWIDERELAIVHGRVHASLKRHD